MRDARCSGARALWRGLTGQSFWRGFSRLYHSDDLTCAASIALPPCCRCFRSFSWRSRCWRAATAGRPADRAAVLEFVLRYFSRASSTSSPGDSTPYRDTASMTLGVAPAPRALMGRRRVLFGAISTCGQLMRGASKSQRSFWKHKLLSLLMLVAASFDFC